MRIRVPAAPLPVTAGYRLSSVRLPFLSTDGDGARAVAARAAAAARGFVTKVAACFRGRQYPAAMGEAGTELTVSARAIPFATLCACSLLALPVLTGIPRAAPAQEVYKTVDAEGHVVYSDRGGSKGAPKTAVHVDPPDAANAARLAKEQQLLDADEQQRKVDQVREDKDKAQQEAKAHQRQQRCQNAKDRYFAMKDATRLYTRDADGNRVYYSDEDADKKRDEAKRAMDSACAN